MENFQPKSDQPINVLTVAELEALIVKIVKKVLTQETGKLEHGELRSEAVQATHPPRAFLETFGSWEDTGTAQEIIDDIYASRTLLDDKDRL